MCFNAHLGFGWRGWCMFHISQRKGCDFARTRRGFCRYARVHCCQNACGRSDSVRFPSTIQHVSKKLCLNSSFPKRGLSIVHSKAVCVLQTFCRITILMMNLCSGWRCLLLTCVVALAVCNSAITVGYLGSAAAPSVRYRATQCC